MTYKLLLNAVRFVNYELRKQYNVFFDLELANRGRHCFLKPPMNSDAPLFYVLFKRDFFKSFNKQFPEFAKDNPELAGFGESINIDYLKYAIDRRVDYLIFVYDSGKSYKVSAKLVKSFCEKHNLVRTQDVVNDYKLSSGIKSIRETTCSFPVKLMEVLVQ